MIIVTSVGSGYETNRPVALKLFHKETLSSEASLDEALFMLSSYKFDHTGYTNHRRELKTKVDLPAHSQHINSVVMFFLQRRSCTTFVHVQKSSCLSFEDNLLASVFLN